MEAPAPQPQLSIAVRITTSSPILDLSQQTPFTISLALSLNHTRPITFNPRYSPLFNGNLLYHDGLRFTNTATGAVVRRNTRNVCDMGSSSDDDDTMPSEQTKNNFVTLHPGKDHVLHATVQPILTNSMFNTQGLTAQEIASKQAELPKTWKWPNVGGLQDGGVYQVDVSEGAAVRRWMQGSVEALVEVRRAGTRPVVRGEEVPFVMVESARFEVRRPDGDGSLDWP
jgi:hypothetical protein